MAQVGPGRFEQDGPIEQGDGIDIVGFIGRHLRAYAAITLVVGLFTVAAVAVGMALPPVDRLVSVDVLLTFPGARSGKFLNGAAFSPNDIVASSVVEPVWRAQGLERQVTLQDLCRNVQVAVGGSGVDRIRAAFGQKLANAKLTVAERTALENEFQAALDSETGGAVRLSATADGAGLSDQQMERLLLGVVAEWARSQQAMGVNALDFPLPSAKEIRSLAAGTTSKGADVTEGVLMTQQLKESVDSMEATGLAIAKLPGSSGVRDSSGMTITDLNRELSLIRRNLLLPAYGGALSALRSADPESFTRLRAARQGSLELDLKLAEETARVLRGALEDATAENRTRPGPSAMARDQGSAATSDVQATLDSSFLDRIVEQVVRSKDVDYRRELSKRATDAELAVARLQGQRQFEAWLTEFTAEGGIAGSTGIAQAVALSERVARLAERMSEIMAAIGAKTFNPQSSMYRVDGAATITSVKLLSTRSVALGGAAAWFLAIGLATAMFLLRERRGASHVALLGEHQVPPGRHVAGAVAGLHDMRDQPGRRLPQPGREPVA